MTTMNKRITINFTNGYTLVLGNIIDMKSEDENAVVVCTAAGMYIIQMQNVLFSFIEEVG